MKGKVYRRNINPSIHQPRAAAKDLISSGAGKHGVLGVISFSRGAGRGGGGEGEGEGEKARQAKIHIAPLSPRVASRRSYLRRVVRFI